MEYFKIERVRDKWGVNIVFKHEGEVKEVVLLKGWAIPEEVKPDNVLAIARLTRPARRKVIKAMKGYGN